MFKEQIVNLILKPFPTKEWQDAFNLYNERHKQKLIMSCKICFNKVAAFLIDEFLTDK